jgi:hypothetical protein
MAHPQRFAFHPGFYLSASGKNFKIKFIETTDYLRLGLVLILQSQKSVLLNYFYGLRKTLEIIIALKRTISLRVPGN